MLVLMDADTNISVDEAKSRFAREAEMLAAARASAEAGRLVSLEDVEAWVESWDTANELPPPSSRR
jgi:predicted transcriptional regulator